MKTVQRVARRGVALRVGIGKERRSFSLVAAEDAMGPTLALPHLGDPTAAPIGGHDALPGHVLLALHRAARLKIGDLRSLASGEGLRAGERAFSPSPEARSMASAVLSDIDAILERHPGLATDLRYLFEKALSLGQRMADEEMRARHLEDVTREARMKQARKRGGDVRKGKVAPDTRERLARMHALVSAGKSVSAAARAVRKAGFGRSEAANRTLYAAWKRQQES